MKKFLCAFVLIFIFVSGAVGAVRNELNSLQAKMVSKVDDIENVKYIQTKTARDAYKKMLRKNGALFEMRLIQNIATQETAPLIYIHCVHDGAPMLLDRLIVNVDKQVFRINLDKGTEFSRFRYEDRSVDLAVIAAPLYEDLIRAIIKGQVIKIRLSGRRASYDFTLEPKFKQALADIWRLYELMQ